MRKKNKLRIILMWMLSLTLILSVNFSVFASNQNITQSDIKISSLHDEEGFWSSVQIHHIRPRQYGGALNDFNNLMPVKTESHRAITSWFRNY